MKLLKNQYDDITKILATEGLNHGDYALIKRRGRIRIEIETRTSFFEFFRRKSVSLTTDQQWLQSEHYEINANGKMSVVKDWGAVAKALQSWASVLN